jgi:hypothetical protein
MQAMQTENVAQMRKVRKEADATESALKKELTVTKNELNSLLGEF